MSNFKNSTLFVRANYVFMDYYFIRIDCKIFVSSKYFQLEIYYTEEMRITNISISKLFIVLGINSTSQIINAYTLITKERFSNL